VAQSTTEPDILIAGAGPAGLAAACCLAAEGWRVTLVDPAEPVTDGHAPGADLRTTALLQPARLLLERAGVWARLDPHAPELWVMRIVDAAGSRPVARDFDAHDISDAPFGWNVANWLLRRELLAHAREAGVDLRLGVGVRDVLARTAHARVTLDDGGRLDVALLIAADGRDSPVRAALGIGARTIDYRQTALAFAVTHDAPHDNVSTEIHRTGGPFTLVPLPDLEGRPRSAVVWMDTAAEQARRLGLSEAAFAAEVNDRSGGVMGPLVPVASGEGGGRAAWPIVSRTADRLTAPHVALAAEAAHVMPPIGAQGLNTSLHDVEALVGLAQTHRDRLGGAEMLAAYARKRAPEIGLRVGGIDLLNRMSRTALPALHPLRAAGIRLLHDAPPIRRGIMKLGLGTADPMRQRT
jgi:2-octaprenyl-6-methoxyphenol hydroxylase